MVTFKDLFIIGGLLYIMDRSLKEANRLGNNISYNNLGQVAIVTAGIERFD